MFCIKIANYCHNFRSFNAWLVRHKAVVILHLHYLRDGWDLFLLAYQDQQFVCYATFETRDINPICDCQINVILVLKDLFVTHLLGFMWMIRFKFVVHSIINLTLILSLYSFSSIFCWNAMYSYIVNLYTHTLYRRFN